MINEIENARFSAKDQSGDSKCFFCESENGLKNFKNFLVCEDCIKAANTIKEEME